MDIEGFDTRPHYVYVLIDPRNERVFYVGKGQGQRINAHFAEASALDPDEQLGSAKHQRINEIRTTGLTPLKRVVARFATEAEAFAVEATLIQWVYGQLELTNIAAGRAHRYVRRKGDLEERDRLDRDSRAGGGYSGDFVAVEKSKYVAFDIENRLKAVAADLARRGYECSAPAIKSQDAFIKVSFVEEPQLFFRIKMYTTESGSVTVGLAAEKRGGWAIIQRLHAAAVERGEETGTLPSHRIAYIRSAWKGRSGTLEEHETERMAERIEWYRQFVLTARAA